MWKALTFAVATLFAVPALSQEQIFAENIQPTSASDMALIQEALAKTAAITTISPVDESGRVLRPTGSGSAFFMSFDGTNYMWTNNHVVGEATYVRYQMCDDTEFEFQVPQSDFWLDASRDFASLTLPIRMARTPSFKPADMSRLTEGQEIDLIGGPLGFKCSVSKGVLSYNGRHLPKSSLSSTHGDIQTDAALNPGNSGGVAAVMQDGELKAIGMNTYIISPTGANVGLGFIQPLDMLMTAHTYMRSHGGRTFVSSIDAAYADLSFAFWQRVTSMNSNLIPFIAEGSRGAGIRGLTDGGAAAMAGLRVGDIVTHINDHPVQDRLMLSFTIANIPPGETITLAILRNGRPMTFTIEPSYEEASLQTRESSTVPTFYFNNSGIESVMESSDVLESYFGESYANLSKEERAALFESWELGSGLVINRIANMSPAHEAGIATHTIVDAVQIGGNWYAVAALEEFEALLGNAMEEAVPVLVRYLPKPSTPHVEPQAEVIMITPRYADK